MKNRWGFVEYFTKFHHLLVLKNTTGMSGIVEGSNGAFRPDTEADIRKTESDNNIATSLVFDLHLIFAVHV